MRGHRYTSRQPRMEAVVVPLSDDFPIFEHERHGAIDTHLRTDCRATNRHRQQAHSQAVYRLSGQFEVETVNERIIVNASWSSVSFPLTVGPEKPEKARGNRRA